MYFIPELSYVYNCIPTILSLLILDYDKPFNYNRSPPQVTTALFGRVRRRKMSKIVEQCRTMSNNVVQCRTVFFSFRYTWNRLKNDFNTLNKTVKCRVSKDNLFQMSLTFLDVLNCREIQRIVEKCIWMLRTGLGAFNSLPGLWRGGFNSTS